MQKDTSFIENKVSAKIIIEFSEKISALKNENNVPDLIAKILVGRKINSSEVHPLLLAKVHLLNKMLILTSNTFFKVFNFCKNNLEKICILGDYDVDGATSSITFKIIF